MNSHYRQGATAALSLFKVAKIFGESEPDYDVDTIPFEQRQRLHHDYHTAKGNEEPTGYGKAIGVGALAGGIPGALLGSAHSMGGMLLGGALGALGGGAAGGLAAHHDIDKINEAKGIAGLSEPQRTSHLVKRIQAQRSMAQNMEDMDRFNQQMQAERRHQEMLDAMDRRRY